MPTSVYPRVCGGTGVHPANKRCNLGLSPRVRGNRGASRFEIQHARSIPACAGEPGAGEGSKASPAVYPRVCGGTSRCLRGCGQRKGLSPRVRGNRRRTESPAPLCGSIPACAGEPLLASPTVACCGVYPRVCGGTIKIVRAAGGRYGLSPRVRGNLPSRILWPDAVRSIPACAGEPGCAPPAASRRGVYPRVCGGTRNTYAGANADWGLSRVCGGTV